MWRDSSAKLRRTPGSNIPRMKSTQKCDHSRSPPVQYLGCRRLQRMRLNPKICAAALLAITSTFSVGLLLAQAPAARRVTLDEAHHNIMATASGGYRPLVRLLTEAEFDVTPNTLPFNPERLSKTDVLVIANPNGADERAPVDIVPYQHSLILKSRPLKNGSEVAGIAARD